MNLKKTNALLAALAVALIFSSCGSSKQATSSSSSSSSTKTEVVTGPCTGAEYSTDLEYFRARAVGVADTQEEANQKAQVAVKRALISTIEEIIEIVLADYDQPDNQSLQEAIIRFKSLSRDVINSQIKQAEIICNEQATTADGKFENYLVIEMEIERYSTVLAEGIWDNPKLREHFEYEKLNQIFNDKISNLTK